MGTTLNNVLIDFNMVIDTDIGLLRFMLMNGYSDDSFFNKKVKNKEQKDLIKLLQNRDEANPLSLFFRKDNEAIYSQRYKLYNEFIDTNYKDIIDLSIKTSMFDLCNIWKQLGEIRPTILCKNIEEEHLIESKDKNLATVISNYEDIDLDKYDSIFVKDCYKLLDFPTDALYRKGIYVADYAFNHDTTNRDLICMDVAECICLFNEFKFIWIYTED